MATNLTISSPSSTIASVMDRAVDIYYSQLPPKDRKKYSLGMQPRTSLADFIVSVSNAQRTSRASSSGQVGEKVSGVLTHIDRFTKIIDSFISAAPDTTALVWGAMKMLMQVAMNKIDTADKLLTTMNDVIESFGLVEQYLNILSAPRLSQAASVMYANMLNILVRMRKHYEKQGVAKFFSGMITPFEVAFGPFLDGFKRSRETVKNEFALAQASAQKVEFDKQEVFREEVKVDRERKDLRAWLSPVDCEADYRRINASRLKGTCKWLLDKEEYKRWKTSDDSDVLWAYGKPGSGKTVLSSFVVNDILAGLSAQTSTTTDSPVALYFFCNNRSEDRRSAISILRSVSFQIVMQRPDAAAPMEKLRGSSAGGRADVLDDLWKAFDACLEIVKGSPVYLIIDALDECTDDIEERTALLKYISNNKSIRSFLVSRNERDIKRVLAASPSSAKPSMAITEEDVRLDINFYVEYLVENSPELSSLKIAKSIISRVQQWAKGMFVWAKLVIRDLENTSTPAEIEESLTKGIPEELEDLYKKIVQNTSGKNKASKALAQFIFSWTTAGYTPLTLEALQEAYQVVDGSDELDEMRKPHTLEAFQRQIEGACGPLVEVSDEGYVLLAHHTTKEFLIQNGLAGAGHEEVHGQLAKTCLGYLSLSVFDAPLLNLKRFEIAKLDLVRPAHPFLEYAAIHWAAHFKDSGATVDLNNRIQSFLVSRCMPTWMETVITFKSGLEHLGLMAEDLGPLCNFVDAIFNWETILRSYPSEIHYCDTGIVGDKRNPASNKRMQSILEITGMSGKSALSNGKATTKRFTFESHESRFHVAGNKVYMWGSGAFGHAYPATVMNRYTSRSLPELPRQYLGDWILKQVVASPDNKSVALVWFNKRKYGDQAGDSSTIVTALLPARDWPSKVVLAGKMQRTFGPMAKAIADVFDSKNTFKPPRSTTWHSLTMTKQNWEDGYFGEAFRNSFKPVAFSADSRTLYCPGGTFDLETGKKSASVFEGIEGTSATVGMGARTIAFVHNDGETVEARDLKKKTSSTTTIKEGGARVASVSPSGNYIVVVSRIHLYVFYPDTGTNHKLTYTKELMDRFKNGDKDEEEGEDPKNWEDDGDPRFLSMTPDFNCDETKLAALIWFRESLTTIQVWSLEGTTETPKPYFSIEPPPRSGSFATEIQWAKCSADLLYSVGYNGKVTSITIDAPGNAIWDEGSYRLVKWKCRMPSSTESEDSKTTFLSIPLETRVRNDVMEGTLVELSGKVLATGDFVKERDEDLQLGAHQSDRRAELWKAESKFRTLMSNRIYEVDQSDKLVEASAIRFKLPEKYCGKNFGMFWTVLSPDGEYAYYLVTLRDHKENEDDPDPVEYAIHLVFRCSSGELIWQKRCEMENSAEVSTSPIFHPTKPIMAWNWEQRFNEDKAPDRGVYIIDVEKGTETKISDDTNPFDKVYWSPNGKYLIGYYVKSLLPTPRHKREPLDSWEIKLSTFSSEDNYSLVKTVSAVNGVGWSRFLTYHKGDNDEAPIKIYGILDGVLNCAKVVKDGAMEVEKVGTVPMKFKDMCTIGMAHEDGRKKLVIFEHTNAEEVFAFSLAET